MHGIEEKKIAQRQKAAVPKPAAPAAPAAPAKPRAVPKPAPKPSPAHGIEEKKIAQRQRAAAPKPPAPAKPKPAPQSKPAPKPSPAHGIEEKKIAQRQRAAAPKPPAPAKPKPAPQPKPAPKPSPAHGIEEKKIAQQQRAAAPKPATPAKPQAKPAPKPSPAHGIEEKKIAQQQKKAPQVAQQAARVPAGSGQARPRELPQSLRLAEAAAERQAKTERQFQLQRQTSQVVKPTRTDDVLQRTAPARRDYAASQQGGAPGTGLRRDAAKARDEANRLAGVRDRGRAASPAEQERNRRLAAEADAKADGLEGRVFQEHLDAQLAAGARQRDPLLRPVPSTPRPPISRPGQAPSQSVRIAEQAAQRQAETERQFDLSRQTSRVDKPVRTGGVLERTAAARTDYAASQQGGPPGSVLRRQAAQARDDLEGRELAQRNAQERAEADRVQREHQDRLRREAESRNRPPQSWGLCLNGSATFLASAKGGGCVVFDSKGVGFSYQETLGVESGLGLSGSATVQASSATIENLNGPSVVAGASGVVGVGAEGSVGVSADGSNNWTASAGPAVGGEASVGIGGQYTNAVRVGDYADLLSLLTGPMPFR
ncbi:hypothetical protein [Lentzea sp.]|uniref:hypothetical protein n=1 Tax=Lentzea sp. TaxID=56099 RepID=UPI002ED1CF22